jgi:hypothetical protein
MSASDGQLPAQASGAAATGGGLAWLPDWLSPRDQERRGRGEQRLIESVILVLVGVVLAVATVHDLVREVGIGDRLHADLISWVRYTKPYFGANNPKYTYHNPLIEQNVTTYTTRDVVCANTADVKPQGTVLVCLIFTGPVRDGYRRAKGGYYLIAAGKDVHEPVLDKPIYSYGCFGSALSEPTPEGKRICDLAKGPPGAPDIPLIKGS